MFKKIFFGINLMGNKLLNAKVEDPIEDQDISNKKFVTNQQIFTTSKIKSTVFDWIKNVNNKSIKEIISEILFPNILPTYVNPVFTDVEFSFVNIQKLESKYLLFNNQMFQLLVKFNITDNDRISSETAYLQLKYPDNSMLNFNATITGTIGEIVANFEYKPGMTFTINKPYLPVSNPKLDTKGNPYVSDEFKIAFILKKDISKDILNSCQIFNPIWSKRMTEDLFPLHKDKDIITKEQLIAQDYFVGIDYVFDNLEDQEDCYSVLIPEPLFDNYILSVIIYKNNIIERTNKIELLKEWVSTPSKDIIIVDGNPYVIGKINFGFYSSQYKARLLFTSILNN